MKRVLSRQEWIPQLLKLLIHEGDMAAMSRIDRPADLDRIDAFVSMRLGYSYRKSKDCASHQSLTMPEGAQKRVLLAFHHIVPTASLFR